MSEQNPGLEAYVLSLQGQKMSLQQKSLRAQNELLTLSGELTSHPTSTSTTLQKGTVEQELQGFAQDTAAIDSELELVRRNPEEAIRKLVTTLQRQQAHIEVQIAQKESELTLLRADPNQQTSTRLLIGTLDKELEIFRDSLKSVIEQITLFTGAK